MKVEIDPSIFLTYRARDIQTSFSDQPTCVEVTDSAISAIENLDRRAYDQAPVTENGNVIGWVMRENIKSTRTIAESYNLLNQNDLISAEAPLNDLLKRLLNQKLVFLVGATGIEGFAVRSDLERHVSRAHLYLLISGLEISMTRILSSYLNDISCVLPLMSPPSKRAFEFALAKREDANPVEYLDLRGLGDALILEKGALIHLGISADAWKIYTGMLVNIRNWVAHSNTQAMREQPFHVVVDHMQRTESYIRKLISY